MPAPAIIGPEVNVRRVILILLLGLPITAWPADIRDYYGVWTGMIVEGPIAGTPRAGKKHKRYEVKIVFGPAGYKVDYPSLGCGGKLHLLGTRGRHFHFRDELEYGKDRCSNNGYTEMQMISHAKASLQWFDANRVYRAEGMLKHNVSTMVQVLSRGTKSG